MSLRRTLSGVLEHARNGSASASRDAEDEGSVLGWEEDRQDGIGVVAGTTDSLELDRNGRGGGGHEEEDREVDLRAVGVNGDSEEEDLEEVPGAAREGLTSGDELRRRIEVGGEDSLGGRHGDAEAGRSGEIGKIDEDSIAKSIRAAINADELEALERIGGIG
jgi:hypothetical protein